MNIYHLIWHDYGNIIHRNSATEDPRPTTVEADSYSMFGGNRGDSAPYGIGFFKDSDEGGDAFLFIADVPLMVTCVRT